MKAEKKKIFRVLGGSVLILSGMTGAAPALVQTAQAQPSDSNGALDEASQYASTNVNDVVVSNVQGFFGWTQEQITSNDVIAQLFNRSTICGRAYEPTQQDASTWNIEVKGDVQNAFTESLGELQQDGANARSVMTCACASNTAGGSAIVNAEVQGVSMSDLIIKAHPDASVNAVIFTGSDGTSITLPYSYVLGNDAILATQINGESLDASVGGTNQLWISSTAAKYFCRDVVSVEFATLDQQPAAPNDDQATDTDYVNRPNVGVLEAE